MKRILSSPTGRISFALGLLLVGFLVVLVVRDSSLLIPLLITLAAVALAWWLAELFLRGRQRKRQADFDERLAAREGIEDRRREWSEWTKELERQNIDRYDLPFYLLVGEPQAGKSVLLQNSDLHFPFGQSRLSGIGGTKGCDWWFTDEAVVLDLAGRLFVHEGGAADEAEWKAFLDLLVGFRPMCPANGILLVVPCNSLLEDSEEKSLAAAKRVQGALTTLTQSLQAELPVYLVLTKADRIFGFAESVHRLEVDERHQMFGWSRTAEKAETAFSLEEAREGFEELVGRARALRTQMMATARLPEALPEVDRLYAFPEELANLYPALEIYLRQVFTETTLLDRLFFRGIYLTSGLQTGVPIAKVCRDMLGATGEADRRELETVFTKQRAYFIKDLVRKRVFAEQGLVRPTERRSVRARKNAVIGLGLAGALALASIVASLVYVTGEREADLVTTETTALELAESAGPDQGLPDLLQALHAQASAADDESRTTFETSVDDRVSDEFGELYTAIFDRCLLPALWKHAMANLEQRAATAPASFQEFDTLVTAGAFLLRPIAVDKSRSYTQLCDLAAPGAAPVALARMDSAAPFDLAAAYAKRKEYGPALGERMLVKGDAAERVRASLIGYFEGVLDSREPWAVDGHLGYLVAWRDIEARHRELRDFGGARFEGVHAVSELYSDAVDHLSLCATQLARDGEAKSALQPVLAQEQLARLAGLRERLFPIGDADTWKAAGKLQDVSFSRRDLLASGAAGPGGALAPIPTPIPELERLRPAALVRVTRPDRFQLDLGRISVLPDQLRDEREQRLASQPGAPDEGAELARDVQLAKLLALESGWYNGVKTWEALARLLGAEGEELEASPFRAALVEHLLDMHGELGELDAETFKNWISLVDDRLDEYLQAWAGTGYIGQGESSESVPELDWAAIDLLIRLKLTEFAETRAATTGLVDRYVARRQERMISRWRAEESVDLGQTIAILDALDRYSTALGEARIEDESGRRRNMSEEVRRNWLEEVDAHLSERLVAAREELEREWTAPDLPGSRSLLDAADEAWTVLSTDALVRKVTPPEDQPELEAHHAALRTRSLHFEEQLGDSIAALEALKPRLVPWGEEVSSNAKEVAKTTRKLVEPFRKAQGAPTEGPVLAGILKAERARVLGGEARDALTIYVREVREAFLERLELEVRDLYLRALRESVIGQHKVLMSRLYESDPAELDRMENVDVTRELTRLFDPGGVLDELHADYQIEESAADPPAADFRPDDQERAALDPPLARLWAFDRFLTGLQRFMLSTNGRVAGCRFTLQVQPDVRVKKSIWDRSTGDGPAHYFPPRDMLGALAEGEPIDRDLKLVSSLECSTEMDVDHRLRMRWGPNARTAGSLADGELTYEVTSCLGPLLFLWNGEPVEDGGWKVAVRPWNANNDTKGSKYDAHFTVHFAEGPAPPERPADPRPEQ